MSPEKASARMLGAVVLNYWLQVLTTCSVGYSVQQVSSTDIIAVSIFYLVLYFSAQRWSLVTLSVVLILVCLIKSIRISYKICRFLSRQFKWRRLGSHVDDIDISTMVKLPLLTCTAIFVMVFIPAFPRNKCLCPFEWQWQVGIAAVFLAWTDLVLYMRKWRLLG